MAGIALLRVRFAVCVRFAVLRLHGAGAEGAGPGGSNGVCLWLVEGELLLRVGCMELLCVCSAVRVRFAVLRLHGA